tara:strand:- start:44 stop:2398 length:2355 start_codon:yes stop_codon:yes gene_type:complete
MSTLKDLEKLKTILFTDDQIASENFSLPDRETLLSKDPKSLTVRESNILRLYDTGISLDGAQEKQPFGMMLQEKFPFQEDTGGEAHKSSPSPKSINNLAPIEKNLKQAGFEKGFDTPIGTLSEVSKDKGLEGTGLSKNSAKTLRFVLNRTRNQLIFAEKDISFLDAMQSRIKSGEAPRSKPDKLQAVPSAEDFYTRHAQVIKNINADSRTPAAAFKARTQRSMVYLWGFVGERLEQLASTILYVPEKWADKGGLEGFIKYAKGTGRAPAYIDASNPTAIIPTQRIFGKAKSYTNIPLAPYLQAIMRDRIKKSLEALDKKIIKDPSKGSLAISLFPGVDTADKIGTALKKGKLKEVFSDLVKDSVDEAGEIKLGMGRNILPKDNRKIVPSILLLQAGLPPEEVGPIIDTMHGKQINTLDHLSGTVNKVSRQSYLANALVGAKKTGEVISQVFLLEQQAKALGVKSLNEIPAKAGLGYIEELAQEGSVKYPITPPSAEAKQNIKDGKPPETTVVTQEDNKKIVADAELSKAETELKISESNLNREKNLTEAARIKRERELEFGTPSKTGTATEELLGEPAEAATERAPEYKFIRELNQGIMSPEEVKEAIALREAGDMDGYNRIKKEAKQKLKQKTIDSLKRGAIKVGLGIATGGAGLMLHAADVAADVMLEPTHMGGTIEDADEETLLRSLETGEALPGSGDIYLDMGGARAGVEREVQDIESSKRRSAMGDEASQYELMSGAPSPDQVGEFGEQMTEGFAQAKEKYEKSPFYKRYEAYFANRPN